MSFCHKGRKLFLGSWLVDSGGSELGVNIRGGRASVTSSMFVAHGQGPLALFKTSSLVVKLSMAVLLTFEAIQDW